MRSNGNAYSNPCTCGVYADCIEQRRHESWCPQKQEAEAYAAGRLAALREVRADIVFERTRVPLGRNTPNTLALYERQLLLNIDALIAKEEGK